MDPGTKTKLTLLSSSTAKHAVEKSNVFLKVYKIKQTFWQLLFQIYLCAYLLPLQSSYFDVEKKVEVNLLGYRTVMKNDNDNSRTLSFSSVILLKGSF